MGAYRVHKVEPLGRSQVVVWLTDQRGSEVDAEGLNHCVPLRADAIGPLIAQLVNAHTEVLSMIMLDLAAGGCRTCRNTRKVNVDHLAALFHGDGGGEPCPVCVPRAEERIRKAANLPRERTTT